MTFEFKQAVHGLSQASSSRASLEEVSTLVQLLQTERLPAIVVDGSVKWWSFSYRQPRTGESSRSLRSLFGPFVPSQIGMVESWGANRRGGSRCQRCAQQHGLTVPHVHQSIAT